MEFLSDEGREAHPQAGLIPESLWGEFYNKTFTEEDSRIFTTPLSELLAGDYQLLEVCVRKKICISLLLSHQNETTEYLLAFVRDKLRLSDTDIFIFAAGLGNLDMLEQVRLNKTPDQQQEMVVSNGYKAFQLAAENGHLDVLKYLVKKCASDKLQKMIEAGCRGALQYAARYGHLDVLKYLEKKDPGKLRGKIREYGYEVFRWAVVIGRLNILKYVAVKAPDIFQGAIQAGALLFQMAAHLGHLDVLKYFAKSAPKKLQEMIAADNYEAFRRADDLDVLKYLVKKCAPDKLQEMIGAGDYEVFRRARDLDVLKYLVKKCAPEKLQKMIGAGRYEAFNGAALHGHLDVLKYLVEQCAPDRLQAMITANDSLAFRWAASNGYLDVLEYLEAKAPDKLQTMIGSDYWVAYEAFLKAAENCHSNVLEYLINKCAPAKLQAMIAAKDYEAFRKAAANGHLNILKNLLTNAYAFSYVEIHFRERAYPSYQRVVSETTRFYLDSLQAQAQEFQNSHPNGVFDFSGGDARKNAHQALYGYYVLRHLIRQLDDNQYGAEVYDEITRLLEIPSIKTLLLHNVTQTSLPANNALGECVFAAQPNELLRLAVNKGDEHVIQQLLAIPVVREEAARREFYQGARGIDLQALVRDRESSMTGLTPSEQKQVCALESAYKDAIKNYDGGVPGVIDALRDALKEAFLDAQHLTSRQITIRGKTHDLPFGHEALQHLIADQQFNAEETEAVNAIYHNNIYHTAWRYLAKPNPWMNKNASYCYINNERTERWSTFEEYQPFIAYLYLAAKDETHPPAEKDMSTPDRVTLFYRQLALINRAHNWDKTRPRKNPDGVIMSDSKGRPITEEYDDSTGDCPSCFSGVKRRLFQALLDHPLYTPLDNAITAQFIRQEIRVYYAQVLETRPYSELLAIKSETEEYFVNLTETELLQTLRLDDQVIKVKLGETFKERAHAFHPIIQDVIHPAGQKNTFLAHYQSISLGKLLDNMIEKKEPTNTGKASAAGIFKSKENAPGDGGHENRHESSPRGSRS